MVTKLSALCKRWKTWLLAPAVVITARLGHAVIRYVASNAARTRRSTALAGLVPVATAATLALASTAFVGAPAAPAPAGVKVPVLVKAGMNTLMGSYIPILGWIGTSRWRAAVAQSTIETYYQTTGDPSYNFVIAQAFAESNGNPLGFENNLDDDTGWWGLAWLQAYDITHTHQYLDTAATLADYIHQDWNTNPRLCGGGGVPEHRSPEDGLSGAINNELFLELTAWLSYTYTKLGEKDLAQMYLKWAMDEWTYFQNVQLFHSDSIPIPKAERHGGPAVLDPYVVPNSSPLPNTGKGPTIPHNALCGDGIKYLTFTYNQGVVLAGLAWLYKDTGKANYLTDAEDIANAVLKPPTISQVVEAILNSLSGFFGKPKASNIFTYFGVLTEPPSPLISTSRNLLGDGAAFKGIFVRDLKVLDQMAPANKDPYQSMYNCFFMAQANSIKVRDTSKAHGDTFFGFHWEGPPEPSANETQVSALEALVAAINVPGKSCPTPPVLPPPPPRVPPPPHVTSPSPPSHQPSQPPPVSRPPRRAHSPHGRDHGRLQRARHFYARHEHVGREGDWEQDD